MNRRLFTRTLFFGILLLPYLAFAWPATNQWWPVYRGGVILQDPNNDAQTSRNVVSDATNAAGYIFNDGTYMYFRLRLDADPGGGGGQNLLKPYGWGVEFDTDLNTGTYEWLIMVDGIANPETISLWRNTVQGVLGDPGDKPEVLFSSTAASGNIQITPADTSFNGDQDYFLDWRFSYAAFKQATGLTDSSPLRMFAGTSSSGNNLSGSGGDLVGASDLYAGFSDTIIPMGTRPTTGTVRFVADLAGSGDVTQITTGTTVYIRVDDADQNYNPTTAQTVTVTLTSTNGDTETITLTETGPNTGIFTGSTPTVFGGAVTNNGSLQLVPGETVTVTYIDAIDASLNLNRPRTDTLLVIGPVVSVVKTVTPGTTASGGTVTYTVTISNTGQTAGNVTQIQDTLPTGFSYKTGTTTGLTTTNPSINGQILTWSGSWSVAAGGTATLVFQANAGSIAGVYYNNVTVTGSNFVPAGTGNTAPVTVGAPLVSLSKSADRSTAVPGEEIIFAIYYHNTGDGASQILIITDTIPAYTTYVPGSLRIGPASSTYESGTTTLTDAVDSDAGQVSGRVVTFTINNVAAGADGKVYFKAKIN